MHYKNGRAAQAGEPVIVPRDYNGKLTVGVIYNLREGVTCNCDVAVIIPGGVAQLICQEVTQLYHAADAFAAIVELQMLQMTYPPVKVAAPPPDGASCQTA